MLEELHKHLVARLVIPMEELVSMVNTSVKDFKIRSTTDQYDKAIIDFIDRGKYDNQVVVLTDYATDYWEMPIDLDIIFDIDNPSEHVKSTILVQHVVMERGLPTFEIEQGLRHLLILEFVNGIPNLMKSLNGFKDEDILPKKSKIGLGIF